MGLGHCWSSTAGGFHDLFFGDEYIEAFDFRVPHIGITFLWDCLVDFKSENRSPWVQAFLTMLHRRFHLSKTDLAAPTPLRTSSWWRNRFILDRNRWFLLSIHLRYAQNEVPERVNSTIRRARRLLDTGLLLIIAAYGTDVSLAVARLFQGSLPLSIIVSVILVLGIALIASGVIIARRSYSN